MSQPELKGGASDLPSDQNDKLSVLAGHARVFSTKYPEDSAHTSSSAQNDYIAVEGDVHPALMEDLNVMNQQDRNPLRTNAEETFASSSVDIDAASLREWLPESNIAPTYEEVSFNMLGDPGASFPNDSQQPQYYNTAQTSADSSPMDVFSDMFTIGPGGSPAKDEDLSWESFMAGLGLMGEYA